MGRQYGYASSDSSSGSESESPATTPPPPRHRRRQQRTHNHKHTQSPHAAQELEQGAAAPAPQSTSSSSTGSKDDKKKKNKPKKPPQESIDQIWERFSQKKFSKALAVLPFAPVAASASGERGNELLVAGYERAAEECRRKVRKIIAECRRINTRYRDPGWDLDWDFKWEKGHCLNSLGKKKFDLCRSNLTSPSAHIPKGVKRVHEIFENPTFMGSVLPGDIKQGSLGNCWFVASLTGLANVPDGIRRICVEYDTKIGIYGFVFYRDGEWIYSIIDDKLYLKSPCWDSPSMQRDLLQQIDREDVERVYRKTYQTGSKALFFAQNLDQNETWVPLIEKAYAKAHGDFACLAGGWIGEALEDLSGGVTTELLASDIFDTDAFWEGELSRVNQEFLFGCSTGLLDGGYGDRDGISEGHAYVIMEARTLRNGTRLCKLRNPWGKIKKGNWEGAWSDGSKEWTTEVQEELNHTFGSDSTFWISYEDLLRKYQHFDRTRLFRDPDWRSCQRWIGVEVPWKPQYNEKFHIKLARESPLVLTLSQLDTRYFRGLQGQYNFRLQFRLHEEGRPGAEEYVVRSHGNYLMDRSVSVELPSLAAGSYVVFISVMAERDARAPSTEDVIRRECRAREENEKLAQVGQAYDLAHSKASAHLQRLAKVRKQAESRKASESRRRERRRNWEKRQIGRDIAQKQKAKDDGKKAQLKAAKRARKAAEEEAARKRAEEAEQRGATTQQQQQQAEAKDFKDAENASTTSSSFSSAGTPQYTPQETPQSVSAHPVDGAKKVDVPPAEQHHQHHHHQDVSGGPPCNNNNNNIVQSLCAAAAQGGEAQRSLELKLHYCACSTCKPPPKDVESDGYSSDSPVEDYERLYDEDDVTPTLRLAGAPVPPASGAGGANGANGNGALDSDEEEGPDPWNAIAVIGLRVYSKDEDLELRVVMEGGALEQDGMGNLGEADLDNAVSNAAGQREEKGAQQQKEKQQEPQEQQQQKQQQVGQDSCVCPECVVPVDAGPRNDQIPEVNVIPDTDTEKKNKNKSRGHLDVQGSSSSGMAAYRTIIERKTSEYDRVMGKTNKVEPEPAPAYSAPASKERPLEEEKKPAAAAAAASGDDKKPVVEEQTTTTTTTATTENNNNNNNPPKPSSHQSHPLASSSSTQAEDDDEKAALADLRHKLQAGLVTRARTQPGGLTPADRRDMSALLAELERRGGCADDARAAALWRATGIERVLRAVVKMARIGREDEGVQDEFRLWARVRALLDDYELTLMTAEEEEEEGEGGKAGSVSVVPVEQDGYFSDKHGVC